MHSGSFAFLEETATSTAMVRPYGWGPKDKRLVDAAPQGHWHTTTFVAGLRRRPAPPACAAAASLPHSCSTAL
jgi:hypothetical protein